MPSTLILFAAGICVVILGFGILKRLIMIALIVALLVAIGAVTMEYGTVSTEKLESI